jgi:hypothetical protein
MSCDTNGEGVAVCGKCQSALAVVCTGGCPEPYFTFRKDSKPVAPRTHEDAPRGVCNWQSGCDQPWAPWNPGKGRQPKKCEKHLAVIRQYEVNRHAKRAEVQHQGEAAA